MTIQHVQIFIAKVLKKFLPPMKIVSILAGIYCFTMCNVWVDGLPFGLILTLLIPFGLLKPWYDGLEDYIYQAEAELKMRDFWNKKGN